MTAIEIVEGAVDERDIIPAGAAGAGRTGAEETIAAGTVHAGTKAGNPAGRAGSGPYAGQHVRPDVLEAERILRAEGYCMGKVCDPESPFDLTGNRDGVGLSVRVVRAKGEIANAKAVVRNFRKEIREIQPCWKNDRSNLQLFIISRKSGVLRYTVFRGGIWNTRTKERVPDPASAPGTEASGQ